MLILGTVVFLTALYNLANPANPTNGPTLIGYYLSTWAVAMFVTFALLFALVRSVDLSVVKSRSILLVGCAALLFALNLPHANFSVGTYASSDGTIAAAHDLDAKVIAATRGHGLVALAHSPMLGNPYLGALTVALNNAGIPICTSESLQQKNLPIPNCSQVKPNVSVRVYRTAGTPVSELSGTVIARNDPLDTAEHKELERRTAQVEAAVRAAPTVALTASYQRSMRQVASNPKELQRLLSPPFLQDPMGTPANRSAFAQVIAKASRGDAASLPVQVRGISDADLLRWAQLQSTSDDFSIVVTMQKHR